MDIRKIPITGKIREDFDTFFSETNSEPQDWVFRSVNKDKFMFLTWQPPSNILKGDLKSCSVCGHGIRNIVIFQKKDGSGGVAVGVVCASNLNAMIENHDIDEINFERKVKLQKATMMKKLNEAVKEREIMELEIKYDTELKYCEEIICKARQRFKDSRFSRIVDIGLSQFLSFKSWLKQGTVNEHYLDKLREVMKTKSHDEILGDIQAKIDIEKNKNNDIEESKEYFEKVEFLKNRVRLSSYDTPFIESLFKYHINTGYSDRRPYSEKQKKAILKVWGRYSNQIDEIKKLEEEKKAIERKEKLKRQYEINCEFAPKFKERYSFEEFVEIMEKNVRENENGK